MSLAEEDEHIMDLTLDLLKPNLEKEVGYEKECFLGQSGSSVDRWIPDGGHLGACIRGRSPKNR